MGLQYEVPEKYGKGSTNTTGNVARKLYIL